ncbi:methyltransferase domain-containing protein [Amycolatopsis sp. NPDC059020]|uniref:methyltransferase domain-containing protein n=1 Tax=unclassified Amycolatopsis TaxID=2618356 RepID=UPI003670C071
MFVPKYYLQDTSARPSRWVLHEPHDTVSTRQWLDLVYSPTTLVTDVASYADRGVQIPVSSSTKPDLMVRMLEFLDVSAGMRILEIGTGTGYNAALLAHRLGSRQVCSVDIDAGLVDTARARLDQLGYHPSLVAADGAADLAHLGPFDRIIATCSVPTVPAPWIHELRPGGMVLAHVEGPLGAGNLAALYRESARPTLQGRFLPWWGCFMRRRTAAGPVTGAPRPEPSADRPTTRSTAVDPAALEGGFAFVAQLSLPAGMFRSVRMNDAGEPVTYLASPDGSWCEVARQPGEDGLRPVREAGPTSLWQNVEMAWEDWTALKEPACHEFGLTITPDEQLIWHADPDSGRRWATSNGS